MNLPAKIWADGSSSCESRGEEELLAAKLKELAGIMNKGAVRPVRPERGEKIIGSRWVVTHPNDNSTKARIVASEVTHSTADATLFANVPSLNTLKAFLGAAPVQLQQLTQQRKKHRFISLDISKAFLNTPIELGPGQPRILMLAPREAGLDQGWVWNRLDAIR